LLRKEGSSALSLPRAMSDHVLMAQLESSVVVAAFTEDEASRLTGVSPRQLRYWQRTGFFAPSLADKRDEGHAFNLYSFRDLVSLQILNALRNEAGISLQHLREVKAKLESLGEDLWAKTTIYVLGRRIVYEVEPHRLEDVVSGQKVLCIPLRVARADMERAVRVSRQRDADQIGRIATTRGVSQNRPVIAGTGIRIASIKAFHEAGYSIAQILSEYPTLTERDVEAAIAYGAAA
jgi:DNA-binding transcriptional MerR regulator